MFANLEGLCDGKRRFRAWPVPLNGQRALRVKNYLGWDCRCGHDEESVENDVNVNRKTMLLG